MKLLLFHARVGKVNGRGSTRYSVHETLHQKWCIVASLHVGTLTGRLNEVVEALCRKGVDNPCFLQEVRGHGTFAPVMEGKYSHHKIFCIGNDSENSDFVQIGLSFP